MKKRIVAILLTAAMALALAACGSSLESEEEPKEDATVEETAEEEAEPKEEHAAYTDVDVTDEMMAQLYDAIAQSVKEEYLEPNNIAPSDFSWPSEQNTRSWMYFEGDLFAMYATSVSAGVEFEMPSPGSDIAADVPEEDLQILNAAFAGYVNFIESCQPVEFSFQKTCFENLFPATETFAQNITFE